MSLDNYALRELREMKEIGTTKLLGDIIEIGLQTIDKELEIRKIQEEGRKQDA